MDGHKFRSGLTEVTGDGTYKCITMSKISLQPLTSVRPSRAAPSQLKIVDPFKWNSKTSSVENCFYFMEIRRQVYIASSLHQHQVLAFNLKLN